MATEKRDRQRANRQLKQIELAKQEQRRRTTRRGLIGGLAVLAGLAIVIALAAIGGAFSGDDDGADVASTSIASGDSTATPPAPSTVPPQTLPPGETPCPEVDGSSPRVISFAQAPPMCIDPERTYSATIVTNHGELTVELDPEAAPQTVNNFVVLARYRYFDGTECHRAITGFMVQCGDPTASGNGGPGYEFPNENPASNADYGRGALAMANSGPDTNGSQFFITTSDSAPSLETNYSLFGQVMEGLDTTLPALDALGSNPEAQDGVPPSEQIVIETVTITES